jgi:hypothetical protein
MVPRSRSAAYNGLIAAPGTPKACDTPSFSITSTAAMMAFIFAIEVSSNECRDARASCGDWEPPRAG